MVREKKRKDLRAHIWVALPVPKGLVSSALPCLVPMLPSVLVWLLHPGSRLGQPATFLHMHGLNFWPATSRHGCLRETVVQVKDVGFTHASATEPFRLWSGAQSCTSGVKPSDDSSDWDISINILYNRRRTMNCFSICFSPADRHEVRCSIFCLLYTLVSWV